jgi:hypothetical protein
MELLGFVGFAALVLALTWLLAGLLKGAERNDSDYGGGSDGAAYW